MSKRFGYSFNHLFFMRIFIRKMQPSANFAKKAPSDIWQFSVFGSCNAKNVK